MLRKIKHIICTAIIFLMVQISFAQYDDSLQAIMDSVMMLMQAQEKNNEQAVIDEQIEPDDYYQKDVKTQKFDDEKWKSVTQGMDYTEGKEEEKKIKKKTTTSSNWSYRPPSASWFSIDTSLGRIILFLVIILILAFVLYKLMTGNAFIKNTKIEKPKTFKIEDIEEAIHESDLERFLREALQAGEYRLAVRIYYLMVIKELSEKSWIKWKKEKTNNEYLLEMVNRKEFVMFQDVTRLFEYAWYGDMEVKENHYQFMSPRFKEFLDTVKTTKPE